MPRTPRASADPAGLGRGPLTRRLPVLWQATPTPPVAEPFAVTDQTTPRRFLLGVVLSARRFTVPAAALGILWQVGEALVPVVMGLAIDRALATGDVAQLALWLAALAAVFLMLSLSYRFASQLTEQATEQVQHRLRVTLSRAVLHVDGPGARQPDGGVVSLMTNDVARTAALGLAVYPIAELAGIVFIAVSLLLISWPLGLVVLAGAPLAVWIMGLLSGRLARDSRVYQTLLADTVGRATDLVAGYRIIKGIHAEDEAARRYRDVSQETLTGAYRNIGLLGRFLVGSTTVSGVFVAVVAALAGWFAVTGRLSIGELIAAVGLAQALLPPMRMLAMNAVPAWASAIASSGRVLDALTAAPPSSVSGTAAEPDPAAPESPDGMARPRPVPVVGLTIPGHGTVTVEPGESSACTPRSGPRRRSSGLCTTPTATTTSSCISTARPPTTAGSPSTGPPWRSRRITRPCSAGRSPTTSRSPATRRCRTRHCARRRARTCSPRPVASRATSERWATGSRAGSGSDSPWPVRWRPMRRSSCCTIRRRRSTR